MLIVRKSNIFFLRIDFVINT